jgi:hypothetical protein
MDLVSIVLAVIFLIVIFLLFQRFMMNNTENYDQPSDDVDVDVDVNGYDSTKITVDVDESNKNKDVVKETVYTQDYYPWWRSTRWWNYDGWLYQKPYYNYWRRPYYYNYWYSGRPLIIGGKRYYKRQYW